MIAILTISPTLIALALLWVSSLSGHPLELNQVGWLVINVQLIFLVLGVVAILLSRKSEQRAMPKWRITANKWIGRAMVGSALFYLMFFIFAGYFGP